MIAAIAFAAPAYADHMSPWGAGWANMPNDVHNTRIDTRIDGDNDAFLDFIMFGEGVDVTNRFLVEETAAVEEALASGHRVVELAARLVPEQEFLGGGWARYTLFDEETLVSRVLNINVRLRLVTKNGAVANEALRLTADNAAGISVSAYFKYLSADASTDYARCSLAPGDVIDTDYDGIADYAVYFLSLKEDRTGLIQGDGECEEISPEAEPGETMLPEVEPGNILEIAVGAAPEEVRPVLTGNF